MWKPAAEDAIDQLVLRLLELLLKGALLLAAAENEAANIQRRAGELRTVVVLDRRKIATLLDGVTEDILRGDATVDLAVWEVDDGQSQSMRLPVRSTKATIKPFCFFPS